MRTRFRRITLHKSSPHSDPHRSNPLYRLSGVFDGGRYHASGFESRKTAEGAAIKNKPFTG
jgi:hypothetical protein